MVEKDFEGRMELLVLPKSPELPIIAKILAIFRRLEADHL